MAQTLTGLSPREAVADALYRATTGLDTNNSALFDSAWISNEEAVFTMNGNRMEGLNTIHKDIFSLIGPLDTTHFISSLRIDVKDDADTASVTATALANHYKAGEGFDADNHRLLSGSQYQIDVVKDKKDGMWKMKHWNMNIVWAEGDMAIVTK